ncbi:MAG: hypothetical protein ISR22_05635 [Candidatus Poseidoniaceae archaeon]|nr:hypothetical protein [Candidatus Poseidoniaceae archaeon]
MAEIFRYGEKDQDKVTYSVLVLVTIASIVFVDYFGLSSIVKNEVISYESSLIPDLILTIFRTGATILAFYTIFILMIMNKQGGFMYPLFRKERESLPHKAMGVERMVPFSSWNLIVFGLCFLFMSIYGWYQFFDWNAPEFVNLFSNILLPMALGMAMLTSTVVTYVIVPEEVRSDRNYDHLFEPHEMVMHNWAIILLAVDIFLSRPNLSWELAIFGLIIGIIYSIFTYMYAYFGGGYYVYSFIDPRIKYAPFIMIILGLAISIFYIFIWLISLLIDYNQWIGGAVLLICVYTVILFKQPERKSHSS